MAEVRIVSGDRYVVQGFGRDQRDTRLAAKAWHWLMYKDTVPAGVREPHPRSRAHRVLDDARGRCGRPRPGVVRTGVGGRDSAILVTDEVPGASLADVPDDQVTDALLADLWDQLERLHAAGVSHGSLDGHRIVADADAVALTDFSWADATAQRRGFDRDIAAVLVGSALRVGDERATTAAVEAVGPDRLSAVLPIIQPAALPTLARARREAPRAPPEVAHGARGRRSPAPTRSRRRRSGACRGRASPSP